MDYNKKQVLKLYWLLPLLLWILQAVYTFNSFDQIRYEEVANAVRNPFWLSQHLVYDGLSTSVGWDGSLLLIYNLFGFDLFSGKFFRLALQLVSLFALADLLRRYLGEKYAWLPLLVMGLSPTLLFYVTLQAQYAIDLQYLPIVAWLLTSQLGRLGILGRLGGWFLAMVAWLSYPPFVFYLPVLAWISFREVRGMRVIGAVAAFLTPFLIALLWIKNKTTFINDPNMGSGVFRGGGGKFFGGEGIIDLNLGNLASDLFGKGISYNFDIYLGEFSLVFPIITLVTVLGWAILKWKKYWLIWLVLVLNLFVYVFIADSTGMPGIRRVTPILASFYLFFALLWKVRGEGVLRTPEWVIRVILGLLLLHHMIVYPINLAHLKDPSPLRDASGFFDTAQIPRESFNNLLEKVQKEDLKLKCEGVVCRYSEIYGALAGACNWNHLSCHPIYGLDPNTNQYIPLTTDLWTNYYFDH